MTRGFLIRYKAVAVVVVLGTIVAFGAKTMKQPLVRIAELEIDPGQLPAYMDALKEEVATSIPVEPGVLKLYVRTTGCLKTPSPSRRALHLLEALNLRPNGLSCTRTSANFVREAQASCKLVESC